MLCDVRLELLTGEVTVTVVICVAKIVVARTDVCVVVTVAVDSTVEVGARAVLVITDVALPQRDVDVRKQAVDDLVNKIVILQERRLTAGLSKCMSLLKTAGSDTCRGLIRD